MHPVRELGAGRIDAARNAHALVFLEWTRIQHHDFPAARAQVLELLGGDARRLVLVLDELAERLGGHVDAAEELAARGAPCLTAAVEDGNVGIPQLGESRSGRRGQTFTAVKNHHRRAAPRHQVGDDHLEARERRRAGVEGMAAVMHALLADIEQRELAVPGEPRLQFLCGDHPDFY